MSDEHDYREQYNEAIARAVARGDETCRVEASPGRGPDPLASAMTEMLTAQIRHSGWADHGSTPKTQLMTCRPAS